MEKENLSASLFIVLGNSALAPNLQLTVSKWEVLSVVNLTRRLRVVVGGTVGWVGWRGCVTSPPEAGAPFHSGSTHSTKQTVPEKTPFPSRTWNFSAP